MTERPTRPQPLPQLPLAEQLDPRALVQHIEWRTNIGGSKLHLAQDYIDYGIAAQDAGAIGHAELLLNGVRERARTRQALQAGVLSLYADSFRARALRAGPLDARNPNIYYGLRETLAMCAFDSNLTLRYRRGMMAEIAVLALLDGAQPTLYREGEGRNDAGLNHDCYQIDGGIKVPVEVKCARVRTEVDLSQVHMLKVARIAGYCAIVDGKLAAELAKDEGRITSKTPRTRNYGAFAALVQGLVQQIDRKGIATPQIELVERVRGAINKYAAKFKANKAEVQQVVSSAVSLDATAQSA